MQEPHDSTRVEKYFTSAQVVLATLQVVNLCAYVFDTVLRDDNFKDFFQIFLPR